MTLLRGVIIRRVMERGFGFIRLDKSKKEYFYHLTSCADGPDGYNSMPEGTPVTFMEDETAAKKGPRAKMVSPSSAEEELEDEDDSATS